MAEPFASRSQMGYLWHNKRGLYDTKLAAQSGDISKLPWRVSSRKLTVDQRRTVRDAHRRLREGKITTKEFEKVFRDQFARAAYVPTGQRRGRALGAKDTKLRKPRKGFIGKTFSKVGKSIGRFFKGRRR